MNDQLKSVFPDFYSPLNRDAALQFCLTCVVINRRLDMLAELLDVNSDLGEIGGDPCWSIEIRKPIGPSASYSSWPSWATFRSCIGPDAFVVEHMECYSTEAQFMSCLQKLLTAYDLVMPNNRPEV